MNGTRESFFKEYQMVKGKNKSMVEDSRVNLIWEKLLKEHKQLKKVLIQENSRMVRGKEKVC